MSTENLINVCTLGVNLIIALMYAILFLAGKSKNKSKYLLEIAKTIPAYIVNARNTFPNANKTLLANIVISEIQEDFANLTSKQNKKLKNLIVEELDEKTNK